MITQIEKIEIQSKLADYCQKQGGQNKAANTLIGVSSATISQVANNNWDLISNEMWLKIRNQIGVVGSSWKIVETRAFEQLDMILSDAQNESLVMAVCGDSGTGKSLSAKCYRDNHENVFVVACADYWNRKIFMQELLRSMGKSVDCDTVADMMCKAVAELRKMQNPLIILDEADKLSDNVLYFFITLYNELEDHCGMVIMATDHLEKRIKRGLRLNKKGYKEIHSRVGRNFIAIKTPNASDITQICIANGVENKADVKEVVNDSENDLRRVKRKIFAILKSK